jgi:uncharacterized lipoprotein YajG
VGVIAAAIALCLLAGCAITPKRAELEPMPAASSQRDCTAGCLFFRGRRIVFRLTF